VRIAEAGPGYWATWCPLPPRPVSSPCARGDLSSSPVQPLSRNRRAAGAQVLSVAHSPGRMSRARGLTRSGSGTVPARRGKWVGPPRSPAYPGRSHPSVGAGTPVRLAHHAGPRRAVPVRSGTAWFSHRSQSGERRALLGPHKDQFPGVLGGMRDGRKCLARPRTVQLAVAPQVVFPPSLPLYSRLVFPCIPDARRPSPREVSPYCAGQEPPREAGRLGCG
jgi:hypothetical protein